MGIRAIAFVERFMVIFLWRIWLISVKRDELGWLIILMVISNKIMESFFLFPPNRAIRIIIIPSEFFSILEYLLARWRKEKKKNSFLSWHFDNLINRVAFTSYVTTSLFESPSPSRIMYAIQSIFQFFLCFYYRKNSLENRKTSKMIVTLIITFQTNLIDSKKSQYSSLTSFGPQPSYNSRPRPRAERGEEEKNVDPSILGAYTLAKNNSNLLTSLAFVALPFCHAAFAWWNGVNGTKDGPTRTHGSGIIKRGLLR